MTSPSYLYGGIAPFQKGDGQEDALVEHAVTGSVHYEVDDQVGGPLLVEVALDVGQAHLSSAHGAGPGASPWGDATSFVLTAARAAGVTVYRCANSLHTKHVSLFTLRTTPRGRYR